MVNLTDITLEGISSFCNDAPDAVVPDLSANMHHLQSVIIRKGVSPVRHNEEELAKKWLPPLLNNNPSLKILNLGGIPMTDDDLILCSRFKCLTKFTVARLDSTVMAVMSMWRGSSQHSLRSITFTGNEDDCGGVVATI